MNAVLKILLSMSLSGGILILIFLMGKQLLKDRISRQWQYYIWLVIVLRLLLPFEPKINLLEKIVQSVDLEITQATPLPPQQLPLPGTLSGGLASAVGLGRNDGNANRSKNVLQPFFNHKFMPAEAGMEVRVKNEFFTRTFAPVAQIRRLRKGMVISRAGDLITDRALQDMGMRLTSSVWLVWLMIALGLLIRKITIYQGFVHYIKVGMTQVSDIGILDGISLAAKRLGIKRPVELCVNPLVSSPLLIGFFHPCIVLPSTDISEKDFPYIILHELTHYKRLDLFYKWLVQVAVCLHWFNPLVHLMGWEITKACEFSCDEAVLAKMEGDNAQNYGKTLLNAMAAVGRYKENPGAVTLSQNKRLLKERLGAIMNFKKKSAAIRFLTGVLTLCVIFGAAFIGAYPVAAAPGQISDEPTISDPSGKEAPAQREADTYSDKYSLRAEQYYETGNLPLFQMVFICLDEEAQIQWLDKIYADRNIAFMAAITNLLDEDCALIQRLAETVYGDDDIVFFSNLAMHMSEDALEAWLDRALADEKWAFQSILFNALTRDDEFDELEEKREKEWAEAQTAEYRAAGVTVEGKSYYYQGQLVHIFLDVRPNQSFYTLNMNPEGTINIKIDRDENNEITGVSYMTEAQVTELFGDEAD